MPTKRLTALILTSALAVAGLVPAAASAGNNPDMPGSSKAPVVTGTPYGKGDGRKN